MTLTQLYEETDGKTLFLQVVVNGFGLSPAPSDISWSFRRTTVPTLQFSIQNPAPAFLVEGAPISVFCGFDGLLTTVFTGQVASVSPQHDILQVQCQGMSWKLDVPYRRTAIALNNVDATAAVNTLLTDAGITYSFVSLLAWQLGTPDPQDLDFQSFGEAINHISEVDGSPWYEMPDGQVRVELRDPIPSSSVFREYFTGVLTGMAETQPSLVTNAAARPRIRGISVQKKLNAVRNRVTVRGATDPDTETSFEADVFAASPWVPTPPQYIDYFFSNELIQSQVKATSVAIRQLGLYNRLEMQVDLDVDGDPEIFLGATVFVIDPSYTGVQDRFVVEGYTSRIGGSEFTTTLELRGGIASGTTPQVAPVAAFIWKTELGLKLNQVTPLGQGTIFSFDGGSSRDFDGTVVSYAWSDNQGNAGTGRFFTAAYDPTAVTTVLVTLTVTDNDGLTDTVTRTVDVVTSTTEDPLAQALIAVAAKDRGMLTIDGGRTWTDKTKAQLGFAGDVSAVTISAPHDPPLSSPPGGIVGDDMLLIAFGGASTEFVVMDEDLVSQLAIAALGTGQINHILAGHTLTGADDSVGGGGWTAFPWGPIFFVGFEGGELAACFWSSHIGPITSLTSWIIRRHVPLFPVDTSSSFPIKRLRFGHPETESFGVLAIGGNSSDPDSLVRMVKESYPVNIPAGQGGGLAIQEIWGKPGYDRSGPSPFISTWRVIADRGFLINGALRDAVLLAGAGHHAVDFYCVLNGLVNEVCIVFDTGVTPRVWLGTSVGYTLAPTWTPVAGLPAGVDGVCAAMGTRPLNDWARSNFMVVMADGFVYSIDKTTFIATQLDNAPSLLKDYMWENGFEGVYLGAADDGVTKSLDANVNVDYIRPHIPLGITWPAGADARRIDWYSQAPTPASAGNLYAAWQDAGVGTDAYFRFDGEKWTQKATGVSSMPVRLRYLEPNVMAHGVGDQSIPAVTAPRASLDNGESWNTLAHPIAGEEPRGIEIAAGGRWFCLLEDVGGNTMDIAYSDNQGSTWTTCHTVAIATGLAGYLSCHPNDPNKIVATWSTGAGALRLEVSTAGANGFSTTTPVTTIGASQRPVIRWLSTGRMVIASMRTGANGHQIAISDNQGANWTVKTTLPGYTASEPIIKQGGSNGPLFILLDAIGGNDSLYRSLNQGDSFVACGGALPDGGLALLGHRGMVYDLAHDKCFLLQEQGILWSLATAAVRDITTVVEATWEQLATIPAATGCRGRDVMCLMTQT